MSTTLIIILCILVADFLTGLIHWLEDSYCLETYPIIGSLVCAANILHHKNPTLMVKMAGLITTNYQSMGLSLLFCLLLYLIGWFNWSVLLTLILTGFGNQIHLFNHQIKSHYLVEFLKDSGLIQSQKQHNKHHIPPYNKSYCVLINFNNAWLDRINFWRKLEWLIEKVLGIKVKSGSIERDGY